MDPKIICEKYYVTQFGSLGLDMTFYPTLYLQRLINPNAIMI